MELILGVAVLAFLGSKIIKTLKNIIVFGIILITSLILTFIYNVPYILSLVACILVKYGIKDWAISIKDLAKLLIISKNRYEYGHLEKFVNVLISCNYTLFVFLCYYFIFNKIIDPRLMISSVEAILVSIVVVAVIRVLRLILDKKLNQKLFSY